MSELPERTADTMSDAIALSSPSGRMSKRARRAAEARLAAALFGDADLRGQGPTEQPWVSLRRTAKTLRELAARGMKPRRYTKEAERLEAEAEALERSSDG